MLRLIALLLLVLASPALAVEPVGELVPVEYVRTIDGDTIVVEIAGLPAGMDAERHVRLFAIDAPEIREGSAAAFASAFFVADRLESADAVWLEYDDSGGDDSFGRDLAWVWYQQPPDPVGATPASPVLLNLELLQTGHAWLYTGETSSRYSEELREGTNHD